MQLNIVSVQRRSLHTTVGGVPVPALLLIGLGCLPRVAHFLSGRALWFDEAALCINVLERSFATLAEPLAFKQIAPLLYLWSLKISTLVLGPTVYAVRLPSLLAGLVGLVLFWLLARRLLAPRGALIALAFAACSQHLIYYAGEAKPYSVDVAVFLAVALAALSLERHVPSPRRLATVSALFSVFVWLSYPSVFAIAGIGLVQLVAAARRRNVSRLLRIAIPYAASAMSFLLLAFLVILPGRADTVTMEYMNTYWRHGFMPFPPSSFWAWRWYRERTFMFFEMPGGFTLPGLTLCCWLVGTAAAFRRTPWMSVALLMPLVLTLAASSLKLYPFHGRMTLFLAPIIFLFAGGGVAWFLRGPARRARQVAVAVLLMLLMAQPLVRAGRMVIQPTRHHELEVVLAAVEAAWQPGDRLYFRQGDYIAYRFLAGRYRFPAAAIDVEPRRVGTVEDEAAFLRSLEEASTSWGRVWFPMAFDHEAAVEPYLAVLQAHGQTFARHTARGALAVGIDFSAPSGGPAPG